MNILIRNLSKQVTEENLKEEFGKYGTVASATIITDQTTGESRGFGFVEMPDQAQAEAAILALHHTRYFNERIRVKEANPKFGLDYWKNAPAEPAPAQTPGPAFTPRKEKPEHRGGYGKFKFRGDDRDRPRRFAPREGGPASREGRPPRRPWGERPNSSRPSGERSDRPYSRFPKREGGRPGYAPRGEHGYGYRGREERGGQPGPRFAPHEGRSFAPSGGPASREGRPPRRPWGERPYSPRPSGERSSRPYSRFPKREGAPRGEHGFGYRGREERGGHAGPRFAPREGRPFSSSRGPASFGSRPPRKPWGDRPHGTGQAGERSARPYSGFPKRSGGKPGFGPRRPGGRGGYSRPHSPSRGGNNHR